jgi:hypothetical protein
MGDLRATDRVTADWPARVNQPQTEGELDAIRTSVNRERPFGSPACVERTVRRLGIEKSLAPFGRPRKDRK